MKMMDIRRPQVAQIAAHAVAVLPIASIEQHGPHLAVSTDTALVTAVAERAEAVIPETVVLCPTLAYGASHHHLAFPGTLSLAPETFTRVVVELVESLLQSGFRRVVLLNGHGGNNIPASQALLVLSQRHDDTLRPNIALASYWDLAGADFCGAPLESPLIRHACEYETSMMLFLHPERVDMTQAGPPRRADDDFIGCYGETYRGVMMQKRFHFLTNTGAIGRPNLATAEKGRHLIESATQATVQFLKQFADWPLLNDLRDKISESNPGGISGL